MTLLEDLQFRGLMNQVTDESGLEKLLETEQVKLYCGFDPTGDSLHIGHLLTILTLRRFQIAGHKPYPLVGGATGLIGDPSGKSSERTLNEQDVVEGYVNKIQAQLERFLDFAGENKAEMKNNYDWLGSMTLTDFLRDVGKHFSLNYMLAKDAVSSRVDTGISFTEFTYQILQSYDFHKLYSEEGVKLQIGGSDQWGNITAGLELIRKLSGGEEGTPPDAYGFTIPLVTKADGEKFGKTAGGAIWLDPEKTSPYEFYQFLLNTDDRDVVKFLKYFTFLSPEEIQELENEVNERPHERKAQRRLAEELTRFVHSEEDLLQAEKITAALFGEGDLTNLKADEVLQGFKDVPSYTVTEESAGLIEVLTQAKIASSKRQAREDIQNGAVYINGERCQDLEKALGEEDKIDGAFTIIRRGKKKFFLIKYAN
ncbi:tyrosine--tRNA ligase [Salisediminibacterium halotolerans]|uniref:Tyrosine--tRNA ligase n=1 Tax=Salisediminibacterium halotolerans TaxID=517425 RepID=A0A1H9V6M3_9BACI|nr:MULTISPECIES: tyrosine--tRNA ligase [Salisediminibacterium]RLJ69381.1 tyrosyl-tRNA synthetase [Actinophytocola xinjiangensis]RPE83993.1 tyrosyl-tRNA synthetase [Salisediminibacterium halotolerans]TWG32456.1 tyrosyl-tRNA synthetase [Salisediminibacterium halotolerans]SES17500.1 tyrosyl-tRNA synthetase [Salisediminibacterium haloalkalitolerans]GEL08067.1 tyrosine--tRNA ligase 1 [Salisediminibacterium halotolerans]